MTPNLSAATPTTVPRFPLGSIEFPPGNLSFWVATWDPIGPFSPCRPTRLGRMLSPMPGAVNRRATPEEPNLP
jgi:hypothetical protein